MIGVLLARRSYPSSITSHLTASIDDRGLVISDHDLGPGVEEVWGDLDYEFWLTVDSQYLDVVVESLVKKLDRTVYLAARLSELADETLLVKTFGPAEGPWSYNGIISYWERL